MKNPMHSYTLNLFNENRLVFMNESQKISTEKQEPKDAINKLDPEEKKTIETAKKKLREFSKDITAQLEKKPNDPKLKATQNYFNNLLENLRNALKNKSNIPAVNIAKNIIRVLNKIEREEMKAVSEEMKAISEEIGSKEKYDKKMEANFQELLSQFKNLPTGKEVGFKMKNNKEVTARKINKDTCQLQYKDDGKITTISLKDLAELLNVAQKVADNLEFTNPHAYQELAKDFKLEKTNINNWAGTGGKQTEELKLIYGIGEYDNKSSIMKDKEGNEFYFKLSGKNGEATTMELYIKNKDTKAFKLALKEVNGKIEKPANGATAVAQQPKKRPLDINNPDF